MEGDLAGAAAQFGAVAAEAEAAHDEISRAVNLASLGTALANQGDTGAARAAADAAVEAAAELGGMPAGTAYWAVATVALAAGDAATALERERGGLAAHECRARACGGAAHGECAGRAGGRGSGRRPSLGRRGRHDGDRLVANGALTARARVAIAQGEPDQAERDAHDALACAADIGAYLGIPDILECLAVLASDARSHREAARFFGAAHAVRLHMGAVRFKIYDADYEASVARLRDAMGEKDFDSAWAEGSALSTEEAIAYARRGQANANDPLAAGHRSPPPSATSCDWSAKGWPTTTSPPGYSSHRAPCKPTSPTCTASSA